MLQWVHFCLLCYFLHKYKAPLGNKNYKAFNLRKRLSLRERGGKPKLGVFLVFGPFSRRFAVFEKILVLPSISQKPVINLENEVCFGCIWKSLKELLEYFQIGLKTNYGMPLKILRLELKILSFLLPVKGVELSDIYGFERFFAILKLKNDQSDFKLEW